MKHPIKISSKGVIDKDRQTIYANITWSSQFLKLPKQLNVDYTFIDGYVF